ncbi:hypothetical protein BSKO_02973 [Bryopsis sp. KO-2023]|nr:hypothetical protein BSKO_02973 [Bryopsis sp. KO-2023]
MSESNNADDGASLAKERESIRIPTDLKDRQCFTAPLPPITSARPASPLIRPFTERLPSPPLTHNGRIDSPRSWSEASTPTKEDSDAAANQAPPWETGLQTEDKKPSIISFGSESLQHLVDHMHNAKPDKRGVLASMLSESKKSDPLRYRSYNGVAVQTLTADVPPAQPSNCFPRRRGKRVVAPETIWEPRLINAQPNTPPPSIKLDGFMLIGAADERIPDNVQSIKLASKGINAVEHGDLSYFMNLRDVDLSDNHVRSMSLLSGLPTVKRLNLSINHMEILGHFTPGAFELLEVLDLSSPLSQLPRLMDLDISGNQLDSFPLVLGSFPSLARLHSSRNNLKSDAIRPLCSLKRLKFIDLSGNRISEVPGRAATDGAFPRLEVLDLSHNLICGYGKIAPLEYVATLKKIILAGNPVLANRKNGSGPSTGIKDILTLLPFSRQIENKKPVALNTLASKVQSHGSFLAKPVLGALYAHETSKVDVSNDQEVEDLAACVIPPASGELIVAAFQRVQAEIEGWRGAGLGSISEEHQDDEPYEDKTFLTGEQGSKGGVSEIRS